MDILVSYGMVYYYQFADVIQSAWNLNPNVSYTLLCLDSCVHVAVVKELHQT